MPQGPLNALVAINALTKFFTPLVMGNVGDLHVSDGGVSSSLNLIAAGVIKGTPGRIARIIIVAPGSSSGAFTLNDCATIGTVAAANEIWSLPVASADNIAGAVFNLQWPCSVGIVLSAVPGAGSPICAVSFF